MKLLIITYVTVIVASVMSNSVVYSGLTGPGNFSARLIENNVLELSINLPLTFNNSNVLILLSMEQLADQLYNYVAEGDYESAVEQSLKLEKEGTSLVIINAVNKLLDNNEINTVAFAFELWNMFGKDIVKNYFPKEFTFLLNEDDVLLINKKHEDYRLVANVIVDGNKDRQAFGYIDNNIQEVNWNFKPIWEDNKVYFKIFNIYYKQYLKLTDEKYFTGYRAFTGDENNNHNLLWYLQPVIYRSELLFIILNRGKKIALRFDDDLNQWNNHVLYADYGDIFNDIERFGWYIRVRSSN